MRALQPSPETRGQAGFSLIELLAVVAIIVIMAAVSLPAIGRYIRNFEIRGGAQQVASELSAARTKAIMRNANRPALFVAIDQQTYQWVLPDQQFIPVGDPRKPAGGYRTLGELLNPAAVDAQVGPRRVLPVGLQFQPGTTSVVAFNRLGGRCDPTAPTCSTPAVDMDGGPEDPFVTLAGPNATITVFQPITGLQRTVTVQTGGRVMAQP
jgi:prepilin-type N-terminal cleavage/methylation domain-containing protein